VIPHLDIHVAEQSQVGEARRAASRLCLTHGFDETARGRVALLVTELGTNLARHATGGRLLMDCSASADGLQFEILSIDSGPGMADVGRCLRDGYSSGNTPGTGFGAVQRLSTDFSVFSVAGKGTVILSRVWVPALGAPNPAPVASRFAYAGICLAAPFEDVSGDAWQFRVTGDTAMLALADGLGHGPLAADAAGVAIAAFERSTGSPAQVLEQAHAAMRSTRGAAMAVARLDATAGTLDFAGAGNIAGRVVSGIVDRSLMSQNGTLGLQIRKIQDLTLAWPAHALVILHSDGLTSRWKLDEAPGLIQCDPAVIAGWLIREHTRGQDDVAVVVVKRA
jgi:anti-sigma regulatory factor (Ser/Thr protein kinase)